MKLENGVITKLRKPTYELGNFSFGSSINDEYIMIQYDPIRIRLLLSGNLYITMCRFVLTIDDPNQSKNDLNNILSIKSV